MFIILFALIVGLPMGKANVEKKEREKIQQIIQNSITMSVLRHFIVNNDD